VTCHNCQSRCNRFGKHRNGLQRYRCSLCRRTFTEDHPRPLGEMRLPIEKAISTIRLFVEGCSIRTIERVTEVHRDTILRVLVLAGERCEKLMDETMRNLPCRRIQCDEIWTYVGKKKRNVRPGDAAELGDQWVFVALDADTKLVPVFRIGKRSSENTQAFIRDLHTRTTGRMQLTTDAFIFYQKAVEQSFGADVDYAQLTKLYGDYGQYGNERYFLAQSCRITRRKSKLGPMEKISAETPRAAWEKAKSYAKKSDMSLTAIIVCALRRYLNFPEPLK
jgi:transposase-like protein/IS1 family transposase